MLEVRFIGKFDIRYDGKAVLISSRSAQSLFAYLVINAGTSYRREKLAGMFWPDASEVKARSYLRHELWRIRKALSSASNLEYLLADDIHITFNTPAAYWLDVAMLKRAHEAASIDELMEALVVYQGELLPGFYDEWILVEREHLQTVYEQKMARLLGFLEREKRWSDILEWAERGISLGHAPEDAFRYLMIAYGAQGDQAMVASTYERCVQALRALDLEPSEQTRALTCKRRPKINIPIPLTSFVGREKELKDIATLFSKSRLVTLTGSGGVGKTRLAIQVVAEVLDLFPDGVWFLDLAPLGDPLLVPNALASLLDLRESGEIPITDLLINYFHPRTGLVIFDNCEHLIEACAHLINSLLTSCLTLSILATSREALRIAGEIPYRVPSLEIPAAELEFEKLLTMESIYLFVERAALTSPGFVISPQSVRVIAQICRRLDGIPLAIELAAARVNVLTVDQIANRLDDRFSFLTRGLRCALPRHQTLQATMDWSYDLLSEKERILLRRLAVFRGGWTLDAAEKVCCGDGIQANDVLDLLSQLINKSLVIAESPSNGEADLSTARSFRYRRLETVRQFMREKLMQSDEREVFFSTHARYFLKFAESAEPHLVRAEQKLWIHHLEVEHDNMRAALEWFMKSGHGDDALRLASALGRFWHIRGFFGEGRERLERALQIGIDCDKKLQAKALCWDGILAYTQGDYEIAQKKLSHSLAIANGLDYKPGIADALYFTGVINRIQEDYAAAQRSFEASLELYYSLHDMHGVANALVNLGNIFQSRGNDAKAQELFEESLEIFQELAYKRGIAYASLNLGNITYAQEDFVTSWEFYKGSLLLSHELGDKWSAAYALSGLANILCKKNQYLLSAQMQAVVTLLLDRLATEFEPFEQREYDRTVVTLKAVLGEENYHQWTAESKSLSFSLEKAIGLVIAHH